jgi:hypothetical protein
MIHTKYTYPNNILKIPTNPDISPYLQILKLKNPPLTPILILYLYMPSHPEDTQLIPSILQTLTHTINQCTMARNLSLIRRNYAANFQNNTNHLYGSSTSPTY